MSPLFRVMTTSRYVWVFGTLQLSAATVNFVSLNQNCGEHLSESTISLSPSNGERVGVRGFSIVTASGADKTCFQLQR